MAATIDRYLKPANQTLRLRGASTAHTPLLRKSIKLEQLNQLRLLASGRLCFFALTELPQALALKTCEC
jgi:hypothetical protein